jgi:hypothetical protein
LPDASLGKLPGATLKSRVLGFVFPPPDEERN